VSNITLGSNRIDHDGRKLPPIGVSRFVIWFMLASATLLALVVFTAERR